MKRGESRKRKLRKRHKRLEKPWWEKLEGKPQAPPTKIENPLKSGYYDRARWRKEAKCEKQGG